MIGIKWNGFGFTALTQIESLVAMYDSHGNKQRPAHFLTRLRDSTTNVPPEEIWRQQHTDGASDSESRQA